MTFENDNFMVNMFCTQEHIHVYKPLEGKENYDDDYAAPFHTDNGLLLMITPFQEHPLQVKNKKGEIVETGEVFVEFPSAQSIYNYNRLVMMLF